MAGTFDTIFLRCLGNVPGSRVLTGLVRGDHSVVLSRTTEEDGAVWRRGISQSGKNWNLECLGSPPAGVNPGHLFLFGGNDGGVIITPKDQTGGHPQVWHAEQTPSGAFTLENVALRDAGFKNRFLDGRTVQGDVVLSPGTKPPFTGTHWEIIPASFHGDNVAIPVSE